MLGRCYYFISANAIKKKFFFLFFGSKRVYKKKFFFLTRLNFIKVSRKKGESSPLVKKKSNRRRSFYKK